jgi:hypothetical protein
MQSDYFENCRRPDSDNVRLVGLSWRNDLSRRIWKKPSRYTQAGIPTIISLMAQDLGYWPWDVRMWTIADVDRILTEAR